MNGRATRAHERYKDDRRVCRATLEDQSGGSIELSVIDMSAGGAALCGVGDTSHAPRASSKPLTKGRIKFAVPSTGKRKTTKTIDVGTYEVVREWSRGLGSDAGIAVMFPKARRGWVSLFDDHRFLTSLQ